MCSTRSWRLWLGCLACLVSLVHGSARAALLDEVVALVDFPGAGPQRSVLASDVELVGYLARARQEGATAFDRALEGEERLDALERHVDRLAIVVEAERLKVFALGEREAQAEYEAFVRSVGVLALDAWLERNGWTPDDVRELVVLEASVRRYLEGRFRLVARPRPAQVREAYDARSELESRSFEEARPELEARLEQERFDELVTQFTSDVRRRARVRILKDVSGERGGVTMHGRVRAPQQAGVER